MCPKGLEMLKMTTTSDILHVKKIPKKIVQDFFSHKIVYLKKAKNISTVHSILCYLLLNICCGQEFVASF